MFVSSVSFCLHRFEIFYFVFEKGSYIKYFDLTIM